MNYREKQLRSIISRDYIPKTLHEQETSELKKARAQDLIDTLQKDLGINFLLDYSNILTKLKGRSVEEVLNQAGKDEEEVQRLQNWLDDIINSLGKNDIKTLSDLTNLLQGQTLKDLAQEKNLLTQKIQDQDTALLNLARSKIKGKKDAEKFLKELERSQLEKQTKWSKKEKEWEQEKEKLKTSQEHNKQLESKQKEHQNQLRKINILFDENAKNYERIDFNGLYTLLETVSKREKGKIMLKEKDVEQIKEKFQQFHFLYKMGAVQEAMKRFENIEEVLNKLINPIQSP